MAKAAKSFKELLVWQKAHQFVLLVYPITAAFPASEIYCLSTQMRRAAISVAYARAVEANHRRARHS